MILHIDTFSDKGLVLLTSKEAILDYLQDSESFKHSSSLTCMIDDLMSRNNSSFHQLSAIHCIQGPGSYTSLRVGVSVAKGLCFGSHMPLLASSSLQIIAGCSRMEKNRLATIPARKQEVFAAVYSATGENLLEPQVLEKGSPEYQAVVDRFSAIKISSPLFTVQATQKEVLERYVQSISHHGWQKYLASDFADIYSIKPLYIKAPHITKQRKNLLDS